MHSYKQPDDPDFVFPDDLEGECLRCDTCAFLVGLDEETRKLPNQFAGCGLDGHLITTDTESCDKYKQL